MCVGNFSPRTLRQPSLAFTPDERARPAVAEPDRARVHHARRLAQPRQVVDAPDRVDGERAAAGPVVARHAFVEAAVSGLEVSDGPRESSSCAAGLERGVDRCVVRVEGLLWRESGFWVLDCVEDPVLEGEELLGGGRLWSS